MVGCMYKCVCVEESSSAKARRIIEEPKRKNKKNLNKTKIHGGGSKIIPKSNTSKWIDFPLWCFQDTPERGN